MKIYQSVLEIPDDKNLFVGGPIRVCETGLYYTRTFGKRIEFDKSSNEFALTCTPEIRYMNRDEVKWVAIISESIMNFCSSDKIKECIN